MKKIIITGAAGLVGMNLLALLHENNLANAKSRFASLKYEIIAIDKNKINIRLGKKLFPEVHFEAADLAQPGAWEELFKNADIVIQLQAQISSPSPQSYARNNIHSVKNVLTVCQKNRIKHLIHFSSSVVISVAKDHYTNTKKIGEQLVAESKIPHTIIRPPLMYGCFDVKHLGFLTKILELSPIFPMPGSGKYLRQPLFVEDACRIVLKLMENTEKPHKNKAYNIIGKEKLHLIDLLKIISTEKRLYRAYLRIPIPMFIFLLKTYGLLTGSKPFVPDQLKALTAGDIFPVENWEEKFKVKYTPFQEGIRKMLHSPYYEFRKEMVRSS